nr:metallophosphoesterase [Deinococcus sp. Leaf326]
MMGDVHGALGPLRRLLERAGLLGAAGEWTGGDAELVFLGDYLDRGPDGAGVVRLVRALEAQAPAQGGRVTALLGNHEVMFLAAARFQERDPRDRLGFALHWESNGGHPHDRAALAPDDLDWLAARPALARRGRWLLLHADASFYGALGPDLDAVNAEVSRRLSVDDPAVWAAFSNDFVERLSFASPGGETRAAALLAQFGGECLVHGHTPVPLLWEALLGDEPPPELWNAPVLYAGGRGVGVDGALAYRIGAGFVLRLGEHAPAEAVTLEGRAVPDGA